MSVKVSVVVPVFNPGVHIDPLITSLQRQTMPQDEFEAVFVDDGSSDDTPEKLDRLAAAHANVTVVHIPNSGWPGRPRNLGIETAVGEYVQFLDHDDELAPEALERLYAYARENGSDVVIGKEVRRRNGWGVLGPMFDKNRPRANLRTDPLVGLLTPHKMFRRAFLNEKGIRFFEGPRRMEDHPFVIETFFRAEVISVLADYPVYYWNRRDDQGNAGARAFDWADYYVRMRDVLDVVVRYTEPGAFRNRMLGFWYDSKGLGVVSRNAPRLPREESRKHFDALRELAAERFPPEVDDELKGIMKARSALLRADDFDSLVTLAEAEASIDLDYSLDQVSVRDSRIELRLSARYRYPDGSTVTLHQEGDRYWWRPPADLGPTVGERGVDLTNAFKRRRVDVALRNRRTAEVFLLRGRLAEPRVEDGQVPIAFDVTVELDPESAAFGRPLEPTVYDAFVRVSCPPWRRVKRLGSPAGAVPLAPLTPVLVSERTVLPFTTQAGNVAIDVDQQRIAVVGLASSPRPTGRVEDTGDALRLVVPLPGLDLVGGPLTGRLRLVPESGGGDPVSARLRVVGGTPDGPASLRARIVTSRHRPDGAVRPGRWRLVAVVQKQKTDLGLVLDLDGHGRAVLFDRDGHEVGRVGAPGVRQRLSAVRRRLRRRLRRTHPTARANDQETR